MASGKTTSDGAEGAETASLVLEATVKHRNLVARSLPIAQKGSPDEGRGVLSLLSRRVRRFAGSHLGVGLFEMSAQVRACGLGDAAVGEFLDAVGETPFERGAAVGGRLGVTALAPAFPQLAE